MKVLIGIPSYRRAVMLAALLDSLERQEGVEGRDIRVFVADNDARDHAAHTLCRARAENYRFPLTSDVVATPGIAAARNRLFAEARAQDVDLIAMVDDDETAAPGWLAALIDGFEVQSAAILGGPVEYRFDIPPAPAVLRSGAFPENAKRHGPGGTLNATGNVGFRCAALAAHGWPEFDQAFGLTGGEDKEFFTRLRSLGLRFGWANDALVFETVPVERTSTRSIFDRAYAIGASDYRIASRYGGLRGVAAHLAKSGTVLAATMPLAPLLLVPAWRPWLLRRVARAAGRIGAALGRQYQQYGKVISP